MKWIDDLRWSLRRNEPLFRLFELLLVAVFGTIGTTIVSCNTIAILETQASLTESQVKLSQIQLELLTVSRSSFEGQLAYDIT